MTEIQNTALHLCNYVNEGNCVCGPRNHRTMYVLHILSESHFSHLQKVTLGPAHHPGPALYKKLDWTVKYSTICSLTETPILTGYTQDLCTLIRYSVSGGAEGDGTFRYSNFDLLI